jgi:peroxiredoxin family protein
MKCVGLVVCFFLFWSLTAFTDHAATFNSVLVSDADLTDSSKAALDEMIARLSDAKLARVQKIVLEWKTQPTALMIMTRGGTAEAEDYLLRVK